MKTAKIHTSIIEFSCPHCGVYIANSKDGTFLFYIDETFPEFLECGNCDSKLKIPTLIMKAKSNHNFA